MGHVFREDNENMKLLRHCSYVESNGNIDSEVACSNNIVKRQDFFLIN